MAKALKEAQKEYLKIQGYYADNSYGAYVGTAYDQFVFACIDFELDRAYVIFLDEWDIDQKLIDETQMVLNNAKRDLEELKKLGDEQ